MKKNRQNKIIELINKYCIETQDALIEKLKEEGFEVTQATASRDIRELNLVKVSVDGNTYKYAESPKDDMKISVKYKNILKETLVSVDYACNTMVLKTYSGMAQAACAAIDSLMLDKIIGTLAGDDTIFVIAKSEAAAVNLCQHLSRIK